MIRSATFSACRRYRYELSRIWIARKPMVAFVGLNPSTADAYKDDPTVRRCIRYASSWGYGGMFMLNLFAYRSTDPKGMYAQDEPVGLRNDEFTEEFSSKSAITVAAWGNHGLYRDRCSDVLRLLKDPHYLTLTKAGCPGHPLYLKKDLQPISFGGQHGV